MEVEYDVFRKEKRNEVISLFTKVFSDSEGEEEGKLIGDLVSRLIKITPEADLCGFTAEADGNIVGAVFFSRMFFEDPINAFILSPMAVHSDFQGHGIGQNLIRFGIENLKESGTELLLTYGDPDFYSKTGFRTISENEIKAPLKLSYPHGWLAQELTDKQILPVQGSSQCVEALNDQVYW